jgi:hypothetical protein
MKGREDKMKKVKYYLIAIILIGMTSMLSAQSSWDSARYVDDLASKLRDALNLSTTQTLHVQDILGQIQAQAAASRESFISNPEVARDDAAASRLAADDKIRSLLNENQKRLYNQIKNRIFESENKQNKLDQM